MSAAARARHEDDMEREIIIPANLSCCCLSNLVFLQQPIIFERCYRVLQFERLTRLLDQNQGLSHPHDDAIHVQYRILNPGHALMIDND